jgi:hypothetical protein
MVTMDRTPLSHFIFRRRHSKHERMTRLRLLGFACRLVVASCARSSPDAGPLSGVTFRSEIREVIGGVRKSRVVQGLTDTAASRKGAMRRECGGI